MSRCVLAVSPVAEVGGGEVLLLDLLAGLARRHWSVALAVAGDGPLTDLARERSVPTYAVPSYRVSRPQQVAVAARALRRAISDFGPDDVVANMPKGQLLALAAGVRRPLTVLLDVPGADPIARLARRLPARRVAISREVAVAAGFPDAPVVPPGVDVDTLVARAADGDVRAVHRAAGWVADDRRPLALAVGRLQAHKGLGDVIAAGGALRSAGIRVAIVGPDSPDDPGLRQRLQADIRRRGLDEDVAVVGALSPADLAASMGAADLLVHAASRETFGLVLVEALALGTPVVACSAPGPAGIVTPDVGRLTPVGDVAALTAAVASVLRDPPDPDLCRHRAAEFGIERSVDALVAALAR